MSNALLFTYLLLSVLPLAREKRGVLSGREGGQLSPEPQEIFLMERERKLGS